MGKAAKIHQAPYKPMPYTKRYWVYYENCYTEDELTFREWIIQIRANSGIHPDFLNNPSSWFNENSQALSNVNEKAWVLPDSYKTSHTLYRDDFHVQPIDGQQLQWPALYDLMQETGDYLILRNQNLPHEHLNQPMNFVLLDINLILKALSQNSDIKQVMEQLDLITKYLRTIEKKISPLVGSDRLFLTNFRGTIDKEIHPQLVHQIEAQLLKDRLQAMSKTIKKLSTDRNRILHFALNINPVNPHPYDFSMETLENSKAYPTQAAKKCGHDTAELSTNPFSILQLSMEQLKDCPNFKLITTEEPILSQYAQAITDLNELARFQTIISQIMNLLSQAGELYTIHQFKEQMLNLLKQINYFIDESSQPIDAIIDANTQAYHQAIQAEQNASPWTNWFTSEKIKLKTYIQNQDTLAQFPSGTSDLAKTNKEIKEHINEVATHLSQCKSEEISHETIEAQAQELNQIMGSMHSWIKFQYVMKGLEPPTVPLPLKYVTKPLSTPLIEHIPISLNLLDPNPHAMFSPKAITQSEGCPNMAQDQTRLTQLPQVNYTVYWSTLALVPIVFIALYILIKWQQESQIMTSGSPEDFQQSKIKTDDLLVEIQGQSDEDELEDLTQRYDELIQKATQGFYDVDSMDELHEDLIYFNNPT